jgi:integrase
VAPGDAGEDGAEWQALSQHTIRNAWITLRLVLGYAARHGYAPSNVADLLTTRERPKPGPRRIRYLNADEIERLLGASTERFRPAIASAIFLGVRPSELLAIRWAEVSFTDGLVAVTGQVKKGERVDYAKTAAGDREIVLFDGLATLLKAHKLRSRWSRDSDPVFASEVGTPMQPRNLAQRGLEAAAKRAGLEGVTFHVMRHTFASILIAQGNDPTYVAGQMGHEDASETGRTYAHLFDRARHAAEHRAKLNAEFGQLFGSRDA